jgi:AraC family transcriptional regulator, regulatory protein of adaptative response / methylated-DNA-[protein]-cysteine methyltransferase
MLVLPPIKEMDRAFHRRDSRYDGLFYVGVSSTGIFCRPSCGARKPLRRNVRYFATPREALFAGYRPCRRCSPLSAVGAPPSWATQLLARVDQHPTERITDATIKSMGIDPARVRRYFRRHHGMTFQAYCRARRLGEALEQIRKGTRLDDVALGHGFDSHSGFREAFRKTFGTPPGKAREKESVTVRWMESPIGPLIAGSAEGKLVLLEFTDRRMLEAQFASLRRYFKRPIVPGNNALLQKVQKELHEYFAGSRRRFSLPLHTPGTPFQQRVWKALTAIPYGTTVSYEELARRVKVPNAQRAVGHSNGLNRVAIVVPCHRVINKDGKLGGYGGGLWRKQVLLEIERGKRIFSRE